MEIGPVNNGRTAVDQPGDRKGQKETVRQKDSPADDVRISFQAQERLQAKTAEEPKILKETPVKDSTSDEPERLRLIRERIDTGYYERASIKDETVDKLIDEMLENINQFYK